MLWRRRVLVSTSPLHCDGSTMVAGSLLSTWRSVHTSRLVRKAPASPSAQLNKTVNALVARRDAAGAVAAIRDAMQSDRILPTSAHKGTGAEAFSWSALSAALFACAETGQYALGLSLVQQVRTRYPHLAWTDESVLAGVLRLQCVTGDVAAATQMFQYLLQSQLLRPRTASLFLQFTCDREGEWEATAKAHRDTVFAVYEQCLKHHIELSEPDYVSLGRFCVRYGHEPLSTLHFMLSEMQEHVPEVSEAFITEVVEPWCAAAQRNVSVHRTRILPETLHSAPTTIAKEDSCEARDREVYCPCCQEPMAGYAFTTRHRDELLSDLVEVVVPQKCRSRRASVGFEAWRRYIAQRQQSPSTCVDLLVDGANLGYYGLSSWYEVAKRKLLVRRGVRASDITAADVDFVAHCKKGKGVDVGVNFALIDLALEHAVGGGEAGTDSRPPRLFRHPLVVLHERHCEPQNMTEEDAAYARKWREKGWLYCTPSGLNDDLCWLYAALTLTRPSDVSPAMTTTATPTDKSLAPTPSTVLVLTNDLMRDHHFTLLSPRSFTRWREQHQIRFRCSYKAQQKTELTFVWPSPFTRCIQRTTPKVKEGSATARQRGWHVPFRLTPQERDLSAGAEDSEPTEPSDWVCITES